VELIITSDSAQTAVQFLLHPSAAASLREGLAETLTVVRLSLPQLLCRVLCTTNPIENLNSTARDICHRVKHWRSGEMILRWTCAAMREAERRFRRVQGFKEGMPVLVIALQRTTNALTVELTKQMSPDKAKFRSTHLVAGSLH
jgi:hypothetical protein